jgi:hypothetical protein
MDLKPEEMTPYMRDGDKFDARTLKKFLQEQNVQTKLTETKSVVISLLREDVPKVLSECESALDLKLQSCGIPECQTIAGTTKAQLDKFRRAYNDNDGEGVSNDQSHDLNLLDLLLIKSVSRRDTDKAVADMEAVHAAAASTTPDAAASAGGSMNWMIIAGAIAFVLILIGIMIWYFTKAAEKMESKGDFQNLLIDRILNQ